MARKPSPVLNGRQPHLLDMADGEGARPRRSGATRSRHMICFGGYGGKYSHLSWLLPLLPKAHHYCEPFGGSAAVLLNREPSPVETYNDIDGEVVNFFRVLREQKDALIEAIGLTPFSREEFHVAVSGAGCVVGVRAGRAGDSML